MPLIAPLLFAVCVAFTAGAVAPRDIIDFVICFSIAVTAALQGVSAMAYARNKLRANHETEVAPAVLRATHSAFRCQYGFVFVCAVHLASATLMAMTEDAGFAKYGELISDLLTVSLLTTLAGYAMYLILVVDVISHLFAVRAFRISEIRMVYIATLFGAVAMLLSIQPYF
jgi:hypothetical protein